MGDGGRCDDGAAGEEAVTTRAARRKREHGNPDAGPFVRAAVFYQDLTTTPENTTTIEGIYSSVTPLDPLPVVAPLKFYLSVVRGAQTSSPVQMYFERPGQPREDVGRATIVVDLEGQPSTATFVLRVELLSYGLHWLVLETAGRLLVRVPLMVSPPGDTTGLVQ